MTAPLLLSLRKYIISSFPTDKIALCIALVSVLSLAAAFTAQYGFGLRPCDLCLLQRIPFGVTIALGAIGFFAKQASRPMITLAGFFFLINAIIAAYHSGVERKWWEGLSGCSTPDMSGSIEELMKRIEETDVVRCDEIPWSLFGLSMANYNVFFCLALAIGCWAYIILLRKNKL